jgi:hypothetical protein
MGTIMTRTPLILLAAFLPGLAAAAPMPKIAKGTPYGQARQTLMKQGWKPVVSPGADKCLEGDVRCEGRPEMLSCAGTGLAHCLFVWRQGSQVIEVGTIGDETVVVDRVRCRSGC